MQVWSIYVGHSRRFEKNPMDHKYFYVNFFIRKFVTVRIISKLVKKK